MNMNKNEKLLTVVVICLLLIALLHYVGFMDVKVKRMRALLNTIGPKREKLEELSRIYTEYHLLRAQFTKGDISLKELAYTCAKQCGMKVRVVVPSEDVLFDLIKREKVEMELESTYGELLCFVSKIEGDKRNGFIYITRINIQKRVGSIADGFIYSVKMVLERLYLETE